MNKNKEVFDFIHNGGEFRVKVGAGDVNNYLKQYGDISTKNFRTWMANIHFIDNFIDVLDEYSKTYILGKKQNLNTHIHKY